MSGILIIPVGVPGSGKSTWVRTVYGSAFIASTDAIRLRLFGSLEAAHTPEARVANNSLVFDSFHAEISMQLAQDRGVVADATNLNHEARAKLREVAEYWHAKTHLVLFKNVVEAVTRNAARGPEDRVPEAAMEVMVEKYWDTLSRLPYEPYDLVTSISGLAFR